MTLQAAHLHRSAGRRCISPPTWEAWQANGSTAAQVYMRQTLMHQAAVVQSTTGCSSAGFRACWQHLQGAAFSVTRTSKLHRAAQSIQHTLQVQERPAKQDSPGGHRAVHSLEVLQGRAQCLVKAP